MKFVFCVLKKTRVRNFVPNSRFKRGRDRYKVKLAIQRRIASEKVKKVSKSFKFPKRRGPVFSFEQLGVDDGVTRGLGSRGSRDVLSVEDGTLVLRGPTPVTELTYQRVALRNRQFFSTKYNTPVYVTGNDPPSGHEPGQRYAVIIPSGEGKSTLVSKEPDVFFDYDFIKYLPVVSTYRLVGAAWMSVKVPDYSKIGTKVLLVSSRQLVPDGFGVVGEFALCDCDRPHPHTGRLLLDKVGSLRHNNSDRKFLSDATVCCSGFDQRDSKMKMLLQRAGFYAVYAETQIASRSVRTDVPRRRSTLMKLFGW